MGSLTNKIIISTRPLAEEDSIKGYLTEKGALVLDFPMIEIADPELTDDLLHLMPQNYDKVQLGQLISAIWSKYLSLQGGDVETQRQLLAKDKELFQRDKEIQELKTALEKAQTNDKNS